MAAVFVPPSPQAQSVNMSNRRAPLSTVPSGPNSPLRTGGLIPSIKRSRPAPTQLDKGYSVSFQPPLKKQHLDREYRDDHENATPAPETKTQLQARTNTRSLNGNTHGESKLFARRSNNAPPTAFERKLVASREQDKTRSHASTTAERAARSQRNAESLESIRQWQRHYKKAFPTFTFYFESLPDDIRHKCARQIMALGAKEEKFFSKAVTHVVTTRPIPPELQAAPANGHDPSPADSVAQTVNPSLLEKTRDGVSRADGKGMTTDVLFRARQMRMKIWGLEKLQRVITTINEADDLLTGFARRVTTVKRGNAGTDLSMALQSERLNASVDPSREIVPFKGPYIYVHCAFDVHRPIMVKEYPKASRRSEWSWPHFRSSAAGKCPFIDDPVPIKITRQEMEKKQLLRAQQLEQEKKRLAKLAACGQEKEKKTEQMHPAESHESAGAMKAPNGNTAMPLPEMKSMRPPAKRNHAEEEPNETTNSSLSVPKLGDFRSQKPMSRHLLDRLASQNKSLDLQGLSTAREPAASGVQPSAITSAIRSQMISSTTAGVGAKAATSKEVHGLKRKVLENQTTFKTQHGRGTLVEESRKPTSTVEPSHHGHTARAASAKRDGAGELDEVEDDMAPPKPRAASSATSKRPPQRKRDPKPGYCENCRDKFDDFEHHIVSRKHRRFATTQSNWDSLDSILSLVQTQQYQNLSQRSFSYESEDEYCDAN